MLLISSVLLVISACGGGGVSQVDVDGVAPLPLEPGGAASGLVVSIEVQGGLLPAGQAFRRLPQIAVYDDGTVLMPGAMAAIYPGPAVPAVTAGHVDDDVLVDIVRAAGGNGLVSGSVQDFGQAAVADAGTTTFTVVVDGRTHVTSVYALGVTDEYLAGISPQQRAGRARVTEFVERVTSAVVSAGGAPYVPERYRVLPLAADQLPDPAVEPDTRDWPLPEIALVEGECTAVEGSAAAELGGALEAATEVTRWRTPESTVALAARPVLPHEPGCPA
jgi:hypothetical protein